MRPYKLIIQRCLQHVLAWEEMLIMLSWGFYLCAFSPNRSSQKPVLLKWENAPSLYYNKGKKTRQQSEISISSRHFTMFSSPVLAHHQSFILSAGLLSFIFPLIWFYYLLRCFYYLHSYCSHWYNSLCLFTYWLLPGSQLSVVFLKMKFQKS